MPCFGPLTLREQFEVVRRCARWRRTCRVGALALLGYLVVRPSGLHGEEVAAPESVDPLTLGRCPPTGGGFTVDARADGGTLGPGVPQIPSKGDAPPDWQRGPCEDGEVEVNGLCFVELKAVPDRAGRCKKGWPHATSCLGPVTAARPLPNTIGK